MLKSLALLAGKSAKSSPTLKADRGVSNRKLSLFVDDSSPLSSYSRSPFLKPQRSQFVSPSPVGIQVPKKATKSLKTLKTLSKDCSPLHLKGQKGLFHNTDKRQNLATKTDLNFSSALERSLASRNIKRNKSNPLGIRKCTTEPSIVFPGEKRTTCNTPLLPENSRKASMDDQGSSILSLDHLEETSPKRNNGFEDSHPFASWRKSRTKSQTMEHHSDFEDDNNVDLPSFKKEEPEILEDEKERENNNTGIKSFKDRKPLILIKPDILAHKGERKSGNSGTSLEMLATPGFSKNVQLNAFTADENQNPSAIHEGASPDETPNFENRDDKEPSWGTMSMTDQILSQAKLGGSQKPTEEAQSKGEVGAADLAKSTKLNDSQLANSIITLNPEDLPETKAMRWGSNVTLGASGTFTKKAPDDDFWGRISFNPIDAAKRFEVQEKPEE